MAVSSMLALSMSTGPRMIYESSESGGRELASIVGGTKWVYDWLRRHGLFLKLKATLHFLCAALLHGFLNGSSSHSLGWCLLYAANVT